MPSPTPFAVTWAGEERSFAMPIGGLRELQEITGVGPMETLTRLKTGAWKIEDVREPIRIGLLRGGMKSDMVAAIVKANVDEGDLLEAVLCAQVLVFKGISGPASDKVAVPTEKKAEAETTSKTAA